MKVIAVTGQTATGKTRLALQLAKERDGELVNFDSRQIYRHLDIITGKDLKNVWLYDIVNPKKYFSSFDYIQLARPLINKILSRKKTPILVGGTYFYLKHLLYGIPTQEVPPNWKLRKTLEKKSVPELQKMASTYKVEMNQSDWNNPRRLIRKIEILSRPPKIAKNLKLPDLRYEIIGLKFKTKEKLISAIKKRVEDRLKKGAIDEVKSLLKKGYNENDPGLKTIGYQQIIAYLKGNITQEQAIEQWITKEVQYAKRQYTFMKKDKNIEWKEI